MSKFKVGDKVVRKPGTNNVGFKEYQGGLFLLYSYKYDLRRPLAAVKQLYYRR